MKKLGPLSGWLALITGFFGLFFYIVLPDLKNLSASLVTVCIINAIFFLFSERLSIKQSLSSRSTVYGANTLILTSIFLGILIFVNLLVFRHKYHFDFTKQGLFTLSPQTKKFISHLPREVKLTAFFQTDSPDKTAFTNLISGYLEETEKITLHYVDPDKNPAVTKQYGVTTYGTIALESGAKETKVQNANEENITNALLKVTRDEQKVIYFLEGHGESRISDTENLGYSTAKKNLEQDGFIVKPLLLLQAGKVPKDASVLVIPGPKKPLQDEEEKVIDDYLNSGGSICILIDPKSSSEMETFLENKIGPSSRISKLRINSETVLSPIDPDLALYRPSEALLMSMLQSALPSSSQDISVKFPVSNDSFKFSTFKAMSVSYVFSSESTDISILNECP